MAELTKDVVIEASLKRKIETLPNIHPDRSIYTVPEHVRKEWKKCYKPTVISIGPYHFKNQSLRSSHVLKIRHLKSFLELDRAHNDNTTWSLVQYITLVRQYEQDARNYYAENPSLSSDEFTEMLLVDAIFIIILFMAFSGYFQQLSENRIIKNKDLLFLVQRDLFLMENQLPFFILELLYHTAFVRSEQMNFRQLTGTFIYETFMDVTNTRNQNRAFGNLEGLPIKHLIDFMRTLLLPSVPRQEAFSANRERIINFPQRVTHLKAAGIRFKQASKDKNLLDIKYLGDGTLEIPTMRIQATTEDIFRNIIFFELRHYDQRPYFISYVFFLDELIDTPEDVQELEKYGIINHWLGSDKEVSSVFNKIAKNVSTHHFNFYYAETCKQLNDYANKRCNRWKAILRRQYFNHPWSTISVIYLVVLLILSILQVIIGFLSN